MIQDSFDLSQSQRQGNKFYAIRGEKPIVVTEWDRAVDCDYMRKQGYGNAVKVSSYDRAKEFAMSQPLPEGFCGKYCSCLKKQSRLAKFLTYVVGGNLFLYLLWNSLILFEDNFGCRSYWNADYWFCKDAEKLRSIVTSNKESIQTVMLAEGIALLGAFAFWSKSFFT